MQILKSDAWLEHRQRIRKQQKRAERKQLEGRDSSAPADDPDQDDQAQEEDPQSDLLGKKQRRKVARAVEENNELAQRTEYIPGEGRPVSFCSQIVAESPTAPQSNGLGVEDLVAERRQIFGQNSSVQETGRSGTNLDSSDDEDEDDDDEFVIVLEAVRERKRFEAELSRPLASLEKLSQTGWKLHNNFKVQHGILDDSDRIDLFQGEGSGKLVGHNPVIAQVLSKDTQRTSTGGGIGASQDCMILEY